MMHEASLYDQNSFVTLTYDDKNLPLHGSLDKQAVPSFLKRLRSSIVYAREKTGTNAPNQNTPTFRYYYCGEYGSKYQRPHYHICLFGYEAPDLKHHDTSDVGDKYFVSQELTELWGKGHTLSAALTFESAAYVARYITKKQNGPHAEEYIYNYVDTDTGEIFPIEKEFANMSRRPGIGMNWYEKYKSDLYPDDFALLKTRGGKIVKVKIPKFYDSKFEFEHPHEFEHLKHLREQAARKNAKDNTTARLLVKEDIHYRQIEQLKREYENET